MPSSQPGTNAVQQTRRFGRNSGRLSRIRSYERNDGSALAAFSNVVSHGRRNVRMPCQRPQRWRREMVSNPRGRAVELRSDSVYTCSLRAHFPLAPSDAGRFQDDCLFAVLPRLRFHHACGHIAGLPHERESGKWRRERHRRHRWHLCGWRHDHGRLATLLR